MHPSSRLCNIMYKLPVVAPQVADFGLSHSGSSSSSSSGAPGLSSIPVRWAAPEVLTQQAWSAASDVWAFGVVLWEIFSNGSEPYATQSDQEVGAAMLYVCICCVVRHDNAVCCHAGVGLQAAPAVCTQHQRGRCTCM
jgi:serine/threonine protein kinase